VADKPAVTLQRNQSDDDKAKLVNKLISKKRRTKAISLTVDGDEVNLLFGAISAHELDKLYAAHRPNPDQKVQGMSFNPNTFNPALVSACSIEPKIGDDEAQEIFDSENWSTGELSYLVDVCSALCMQGLDIPFIDKD
jgi:hypothetical protein